MILTLFLTPFALFLICLIAEWSRRRHHELLCYLGGCTEPPNAKQSSLLFGLDWLYEFSQSAKQNRVLQHHSEEHDKYGHAFVVHVLGSSIVHTSEPEHLKQILASQFDTFDLGSARHLAFSPLLGSGIFTVSGDAWHEARHLLKPNFSRNHLKEMLVPLGSRVGSFLKSITPDQVVDLQPLLLKLTLDTASEFLLGISTAEYSHGEAFSSAFETAQAGMAVRARLGFINNLYTDGKFSKACTLIHKYVDDLIQVALTRRDALQQDPMHMEEPYVFLYELADKLGNDPSALRYHVLNILVAGRDTTAGLISITCFLLARHKDVWERLQEEINTLNGQHPTFEQIKQLRYLSYVLKEVLRLYPVTPLIGRQANKDAFLPGPQRLFVRNGQRIALSIHAIHRRHDIYGTDADEFRPARWHTLRPAWGFLPFSGGPRICIGRMSRRNPLAEGFEANEYPNSEQFALVEASYVLIRILQSFRNMEACDERSFTETVGLTLASRNGTLVRFTGH